MKNALIVLSIIGIGGLIILLILRNNKSRNKNSNMALDGSVTSSNAIETVNGMTRAQYEAAGYSQADINLIFS